MDEQTDKDAAGTHPGTHPGEGLIMGEIAGWVIGIVAWWSIMAGFFILTDDPDDAARGATFVVVAGGFGWLLVWMIRWMVSMV